MSEWLRKKLGLMKPKTEERNYFNQWTEQEVYGHGKGPAPFKPPVEDVDSMRVAGPADTDAMRVNPSPNDPTLQAFAHELVHGEPILHGATAIPLADWTDKIGDHEAIKKGLEEDIYPVPLVTETTDFKVKIAPPPTIKYLIKQHGDFEIKLSPSEEALFKALEEAGWYEAIKGPDDKGIRGMSREEAEEAGLVGRAGDKGAISQCWGGDPRLNPKRGHLPSHEDIAAIYGEMVEEDLLTRMRNGDMSTNPYTDEWYDSMKDVHARISSRLKEKLNGG